MSFVTPRFIQKYGSKLKWQNIKILENKISPEYISTKYSEYLHMNNIIYLFKWDMSEDTEFLNKDQCWWSFSHNINKHNLNKNNNLSIIRSKIYTQIFSKTLKNDMNTNWVCSHRDIDDNNNNNIYDNLNISWETNNDIRCIFQEISTNNGNNNNNHGTLNVLIRSLIELSQLLKDSDLYEKNVYSLNLSHLCLKISGAHSINLHENLDSASISSQNNSPDKIEDKVLDYKGLLKLATLSREETDLQKLMKLLIKNYGFNKPSLVYDSLLNEKWLVLSH